MDLKKIITEIELEQIIIGAVVILIISLIRSIGRKNIQIEVLQNKNEQLSHMLQVKESELLKDSINPHFFKNTMSILNNFAQKTMLSVQKLTPALNHMVYESKKDFIPLIQEVQFIKNFIELHKLNIHPEFNVDVNINLSVEHENRLIPPLLFLDFIENAFKFSNVNEPNGYIKLNLWINDDQNLVYEVLNAIVKQDNGVQSGFGMDNLRKRLALIYQNSAELNYEINENIFLAKLIIPAYANYK